VENHGRACAGFRAQLLDPDERLLIDQARKLEKAFLGGNLRQVGDAAMKAAKEVLDFKTVAEKGIKAGKIKSIIHPSLASHVRREAVRFVHELQTAARTGSNPARRAAECFAARRTSNSPVPQPTSNTLSVGLIRRRASVCRVVALT
jgi:hypothetical protein